MDSLIRFLFALSMKQNFLLLPFASDQCIHLHYNLELGAELYVNISHCNKRLLKSITFLRKKWDVFNFNCLSSVLVHI